MGVVPPNRQTHDACSLTVVRCVRTLLPCAIARSFFRDAVFLDWLQNAIYKNERRGRNCFDVLTPAFCGCRQQWCRANLFQQQQQQRLLVDLFGGRHQQQHAVTPRAPVCDIRVTPSSAEIDDIVLPVVGHRLMPFLISSLRLLPLEASQLPRFLCSHHRGRLSASSIAWEPGGKRTARRRP